MGWCKIPQNLKDKASFSQLGELVGATHIARQAIDGLLDMLPSIGDEVEETLDQMSTYLEELEHEADGEIQKRMKGVESEKSK